MQFCWPQQPGCRPNDQAKCFRASPVPLNLRPLLARCPFCEGDGRDRISAVVNRTLQQLPESDLASTSRRGTRLVHKAEESRAGSRDQMMPLRSGGLAVSF